MPEADNRQILIGVHVTGAGDGLAATLLSVWENTPLNFGLRVLLDVAPARQPQLLQFLPQLQQLQKLHLAGSSSVQLAHPVQPGAAACFNQLVGEPADVYVFLECGVRVSPGWLELLLAGLDSDPSHGLAGPSTNRGWNDQVVAPGCGAQAQALWDQADALLARYGNTCVSLAPLHSLSDFCYVVKNEVVAAIGAADTAYSQGPCWEMDYNVRALRAGFQGIWVPGAFVHRGPRCSELAPVHDALLQTNKRLYQDRFCALREEALPHKTPYHAHCAGEGCRHFAVPEKMRIFLPLPLPLPLPFPLPLPLQAKPAPQSAQSTAPSAPPLLSCVMPTRGRAAFVAQSIRYFQRQDYPTRELIIVYEQASDLPPGIDDPRIRCICVPPHTSIGAKRNEAVAVARGELIAHWDDDDWYGPQRLSRQATPILHNLADVTGLNDMLFMARPLAAFWSSSRALFRRMFVDNVSGGTLVFKRSLWERQGRYPDTSLREDADFLVQIQRGGARLCRISGRSLCIYVRHDGNTWKFKEGHYLQQAAWTQVPVPDCLTPEDRHFYFPEAGRAESVPGLTTSTESTENTESNASNASSISFASRKALQTTALPLVSCIMPTADRREWVPQAIQHFLAQDYGPRELIVMDDGHDSVADLIPSHPSIRYLCLSGRFTIGAKRNIACETALGDIIAHWDDDDWMAPTWLSSQVRTLLNQGADICGLDKVFFYAPRSRQAWQYVYDGRTPWVCGGTLCYRRDFWRMAPFPDVNVGEDNAFVWSVRDKRIAINPDQHLYVARVHAGNTSPKDTWNRRWHSHPVESIERLIC